MTLEKNQPQPTAPTAPTSRSGQSGTQGVPALEPLRGGPRTAISAAVAKRLFHAAVARLDVTVVEEPTGRRFGQGGPTMRLHRPDEFYARLTDLVASGACGAVEELTSPDDNLQAVFKYLVRS